MDGFIVGFPSPEEMQRQRDLAMMANEDAMRRVNELLESLDTEKLVTLKDMLAQTLGSEHFTYATHTIGWIQSMLHYQHGVCPSCGSKHDDIPTTDKEQPDG